MSKRVFDCIDTDPIKPLMKIDDKMLGANGHEIDIYGRTTLQLTFGDTTFQTSLIMCDIVPDGIIGQDFLLRHASRIDYKSLAIFTNQGRIKCWIGGEAEARSRVLTTDNVHIPPMSVKNVVVKIEKLQSFPELILVMSPEDSLKQNTVRIVEGIIETRDDQLPITIVNSSDKEIEMPPNIPIGICEPFFESHSPYCCASRTDGNTKPKLPDHLTDLPKRSSSHLDSGQN